MNKKEFLDLLRYYLRDYPINIVNDIVGDYEAHFFEGLQNGKMEEEISKELGSPRDIADEFLNNSEYRESFYQNNAFCGSQSTNDDTGHASKQESVLSKTIKITLMVIGGMLLLPIIFSLVVSLLTIIFSIFISIFSVGISSFVMGGALIITHFVKIPYFVGFFGYIPSLLSSIFIGIFMMSFAILIMALLVKLWILFAKLMKNIYLSIRWRLQKRRSLR